MKTKLIVPKQLKPKKIWVTVVDLTGKVQHLEISEGHPCYEPAITAGNYAFTEDGAYKVWTKVSKLYSIIRLIELLEGRGLKPVKSTKKTTKKTAKKKNSKSKKN